jgi:hypothetical protein
MLESRRKGQVQTKIMDFFQKRENEGETHSMRVTPEVQEVPRPSTSANQERPVSTSLKERGYSFCNRNLCRYCPKLNKSGKLKCNVTGQVFDCMKNISCRSSNVIYAITCTRCHKQYVGQTLLRVKDRFVKHFYDVEKGDRTKAVGYTSLRRTTMASMT